MPRSASVVRVLPLVLCAVGGAQAQTVPAQPITAHLIADPDGPAAFYTGAIVLSGWVGTDGRADSLRVIRRLHPVLDSLVLASAAGWTYRPALRDGRAVAGWSQIRLDVSQFAPYVDAASRRADARIAAAHAFARLPSGRSIPTVHGVDGRPCEVLQPAIALYTTPSEGAYGEGRARMRVEVDETGQVTGVEVVEARNRGMRRASAEAMRRWRFAPALCDGVAVGSWSEQVIRFREVNIGR